MEEIQFKKITKWWVGLTLFSLIVFSALWLVAKSTQDDESVLFAISAVLLALTFGTGYYFGIIRRGHKWLRFLAQMGIIGALRSLPQMQDLQDGMDFTIFGIALAVKGIWVYFTWRLASLNKAMAAAETPTPQETI